MKSCVVDSGHVASSRWLVLFWSKREGVDVDTGVRSSGVVLPWLNLVKIGTLTLRESVLAVKLKLSNNNWILTPAVHVKGGFSKNEGASIGNSGSGDITDSSPSISSSAGGDKVASLSGFELVTRDEFTIINISTECLDGVRKSINSIGVVEWLSTKSLVEGSTTLGGSTVVYVAIRLYNPDEFLARVVEVKSDLVGRGTNGFSTSVLELLNEVLVWVLCHTSSLVGVKVDVVNVEGSGNEGLRVSRGSLNISSRSCSKISDCPQALVNCAKVKVDLDFVVLKSNEWKSKTWVGAEPELKRNVEGGFWKSVSWSTNLSWSRGVTRSINVSEGWVGDEGELGGVTNHLVVATFLFLGHGELAPDVHPVTVLLLNSLATNFNLNGLNKLMSREIKPSCVKITIRISHRCVDLWESDLKVGSVSKITISGDGAVDTSAEISLAIEDLFNGFHCEVGVSSISDLPEGDLWVTSKVDVLSAVSYELHKSSSHV